MNGLTNTSQPPRGRTEGSDGYMHILRTLRFQAGAQQERARHAQPCRAVSMAFN